MRKLDKKISIKSILFLVLSLLLFAGAVYVLFFMKD